ncbi:MAG: DUF5054 domain-containing protein [Chloroflexi bacterium]|nr:DUF5054 domain-containing protein [Chloroflexota bacterium]MCC6891619.1 DUF5054 domain-containing protein [Anaerolineae bacterium]
MPQQPETIHLVFKTHLDIGFTDYAKTVFDTYFEKFIPSAIDTARQLRASGSSDRFIWTTGSWLIYEYLEQANAKQRKELETAIELGDIVWHGLPFTTHTELMSAALFKHGLSLSQQLDKRFGKTTIAAKMTDVPGHTRGMIPLLAEAGIQFLHLGANQASTPPDVPPTFTWRDEASGKQIAVMYQKGGYGGLIRIAGLAHTLAFAHTNDNHGAQSLNEVQALFSRLREQFPDANIIGSTMEAYAAQLAASSVSLPVVTQELGDTWIQGVGSDPYKVSRYRELERLRQEWMTSGKVKASEKKLIAFSNKLMLIPEHTWGMDEKVHLKDYTHYDRKSFDAARLTEPFRHFAASWEEQRAYVTEAVEALGKSPLATEANARLDAIQPQRPDLSGFQKVTAAKTFDTPLFDIGFDIATGAINHLRHKPSQRDWSSVDHLLALLRYQTFSEADYARYWKHYIINKRATKIWSWDDNMKPGMEAAHAKSQFWLPALVNLWTNNSQTQPTFIAELTFDGEAITKYGCPKVVFVRVAASVQEPVIKVDLQWFEKAANRLPEALWLGFQPVTRQAGQWILDKLGADISPLDVIRSGNRKLHAVESGVWYNDHRQCLNIETLDAPLVAPGEPSLLDFNNRQPVLKNGMHFNLYNNVWGTNFPMWYGEDSRFRFRLRFGASSPSNPS